MDIVIPADLTQLDDDALEELGNQIEARVTELADGDVTAESVAELEELGEGFDRVCVETANREQAAAELAERQAAALSRFAPAEDPEADAEVVPAEDVEVVGQEPIAAAIEDGLRPGTEVEATLATTEEGAAELATRPTPARTRPRPDQGLAEMNARRKRSGVEERPAVNTDRLTAEFVATAEAQGFTAGSELTIDQLAEALTRKRYSFANVPAGARDYLTVATATMEFDPDRTLSGDLTRNFSILSEVRRETMALVASGGNCAPAAPLYDIFRMAQPQSPVEDNLPVVPAPRGGVRWVVPPDFRSARGAIGVTTESEDRGALSSSGTGLKPCMHVTCPDTSELHVTAVSECVKFGNLSYRTFPEQVAGFLADVAWNFSSVKEVLYLDRIDAGSTSVTTTQVYGATRSIVRDALKAAVGYRLRNGMSIDARLDWYVPVWAAELIKIDMIADHSMGLGFLNASISQVTSALEALGNFNITWTYEGSTANPTQAFRVAQSAGAINAFPTNVVTYMHAPGTFARLDAGTLDVGLVRDSALNRTNDLQIFSEQWIEVAKLGIESIEITHQSLCPTGTGPATATALTC